VITMNDLRALGYCSWGTKRVCRVSNLDFKKLLREGLTLEEIQQSAPPKYVEEITKAYGDRYK